jgi:mono/diheme cytochrome c family protein
MRVGASFAAALVLVVGSASCGGGEEKSATPETVEGEIREQTIGEGDPAAGKAVFTSEAKPGCGTCHTFKAAGTTSETGPNLDETLSDDDRQSIYQSIINPDAEITEGFQEGVMPDDYREKLSEKQLADVVAFLNQNKGG